MTNIPGFWTRIDLSFDYWFAIWTVGSALAFVAVARGPGRWDWGLVSCRPLSLRPGGDCPYRKCYPARMPLKSATFKKMKLSAANQAIGM